MELTARVTKSFEDSIKVKQDALAELPQVIAKTGAALWQVLLNQNKVLLCGNGGSAADAQHMASEFVNRFEMERPGLPAIALTTDGPTITSIANDHRYDEIFARQIHALGNAGDALIAFTTSGQSTNILHAIEAAQERGLLVVLISGRDGGEAATRLRQQDIELRMPAQSTARIQELHILIVHCLCELIDLQFSGRED
ncbi:MAG: SIS domain-containing protein [Gammaproteobacteria bacterium]|nr:SIS domain-containing protein [Gammaproteobacteria bacterium]